MELGRNLWRVCFTATFDGYFEIQTRNFDTYHSKHRVSAQEFAEYLQHSSKRKRDTEQATRIYLWKFREIQVVRKTQYLDSDSRVIWIDYDADDVKTSTPNGTSVFTDRCTA